MPRIYSAIFGSGLGHAARVCSIAEILSQYSGCSFLYSAFDEGYEFLKRSGADVRYAPPLSVQWNVAGGFSGSSTVLGTPRLFASFLKQVIFERENISSYNPRIVLSDSRLSAVMAGKSQFLPVVTILNQIRILFPPRFRVGRFSRLLERIEGDILGLFWSLSDKVLIPDLPPPFTISEANVSNLEVSNKMSYTGFMTPRSAISEERISKVRSTLQLDSRRIVFVQISGPNATKGAFVQPALKAASALSREYNVIISKGNPSESTTPAKLANGGWVYEWCPVKDELFALSDVIVVRAGHTTISQCINSGKPTVVVPIFNHSEQLWNAEKLSRLGLGIEIRSEDLDSERLTQAVEECFNNSKYKQNMQKLKQVSERFDGIQEAANTIKRFL